MSAKTPPKHRHAPTSANNLLYLCKRYWRRVFGGQNDGGGMGAKNDR